MFTKADSRVSQSRMVAISTFSAGTSNAMHSEPSWSSVRRIGGGGLCTVGFSRANLCHGYCRRGRWRVRPTGFAVSTKRSTTSNSMRFAGRSGVAVRSVKRIGWSRSPVDWTSNRRYEHADVRKRSPFQPTNETKSPDPFSSPAVNPITRTLGLMTLQSARNCRYMPSPFLEIKWASSTITKSNGARSQAFR